MNGMAERLLPECVAQGFHSVREVVMVRYLWAKNHGARAAWAECTGCIPSR